jgi:hypothetical protein
MNGSEAFQDVRDLEELECALRQRCGSLGCVRRLDLIPDAGSGCVLCRLEAEPGDRHIFQREFGGSLIGSGLYFDIPHRFEDAR